ncbi:SDR family NAD(P)-dependent oxidoreductase [Labrys wisconsinensis]|uniref:NAD(P)-dependent dehydrogenase (Short-subunit alcohol dehydrogenase family) n=1 Tax=Labrys wisconsinensis TaxID=425677 RepID=A0ABU0JLD5_9HYPH|nr:glucose 1-dehydrogenase [Labrys wisconsinensis]MDQ0474178.1 NAD(P)-dependent dehydrogenase (short-subunit alcohol dehydrogenase family) [Labrys wisconsinensis]
MSYLKKYDLTGKVAVVTGAGRGIGLAACEALEEAGAHVVMTDLDEERVRTACAGLAARGARVEAAQLDVADRAAVERLHDDLLARHGRMDILVNNAGIALSNTPAETMTDERWLKVLDVNLNGLFWCSRTFGRSMLAAGSGSIVNIGSMSGFIVNKPQEQAHYNASKAAVHHLTKSLAAEWASRGVRVNAVAPTYIDTELNALVRDDPAMYAAWIGNTPMARLGRVDEVASAILFLACDASSLLTGSIVQVDGGYTCW